MTLLRQGYGAVQPLALVAVLLAASISVQAVRDRGWEPYQPPNPLLWVQSGPLVQRLALSYDAFLADLYWMRAVVYYGGMRRSQRAQKSYETLFPMLDLVTSLDPHFRVAYRFGAIFLTEAFPDGPGRPDQAVQLLERGIERDFGRWEYFYDIGFIHYLSLNEYDKAAEWFLKASERPGAPTWLKPLAGTTLASGGSRATARQLWRQMLNSEVEYISSLAELRLKQLDAMDVIDQLNFMVERFRQREQRLPKNVDELVIADRLRGMPVDDSGLPYVLNATTGKFDVHQKSPLWPLPVIQNPNLKAVP
jgi:tetratricopeptide (TPR) repeat protein